MFYPSTDGIVESDPAGYDNSPPRRVFDLDWLVPQPRLGPLADARWEIRLTGDPTVAIKDPEHERYWAGTITVPFTGQRKGAGALIGMGAGLLLARFLSARSRPSALGHPTPSAEGGGPRAEGSVSVRENLQGT